MIRSKTNQRIAGIIEAADFLQVEIDRQKAWWLANGATLEYMEAAPEVFAHTGMQKCANMIRALVNAPCTHQWKKVASSMAESKYKCIHCSEEDWR